MLDKILDSKTLSWSSSRRGRTSSSSQFHSGAYDGDEEDEDDCYDPYQTTSFSGEEEISHPMPILDRKISKSSERNSSIWSRSFSSSNQFRSTKFENSSSSEDDEPSKSIKPLPTADIDIGQMESGIRKSDNSINENSKMYKEVKESDWPNIYKMSSFAFIDAFQFSFFVWSFWPFVQQLDPNISPTFIGFIMAISGVGEAISAPLLGYWTNRIGHVNIPLLASLTVSVVGNITYICLNAVPETVTPIALLASRFLSGAGSGNRGTTLAYIAASSLPTDRTRAMAMCGGGALIGITAGPSIQMAFTWIGSYGIELFAGIRISMYTAPAVLALLINIMCVFFIISMVDGSLDDRLRTVIIDDTSSTKTVMTNESDTDSADLKGHQLSTDDSTSITTIDELQKVHKSLKFKRLGLARRQSDVSLDERTDVEQQQKPSKGETVDTLTQSSTEISAMPIPMDMLAVIICMATRSARMLVTSNVESIGAPYSQVMFNLNEHEVLDYSSMSQAALGALTFGMLVIYAATSYTKKVSERTSCIGAMIALLAFHLLTFPWSFLPDSDNISINCSQLSKAYDWCNDLRPINIYIYYTSYILVFGIALPCLNNSLQSLYSLVLGNCRQGTMQGLNQAVGSLSRIIGPLIMSTTFTHFGPRATWIVEIATLSLFLAIWFTSYKHLVPLSERRIKTKPNIVESKPDMIYSISLGISAREQIAVTQA